MCKVITPDAVQAHTHAEDPMEIAELLRQTLSEELLAMNELTARWHMIEDEEVRHDLFHVMEWKRKSINSLWQSLTAVEAKVMAEGAHGHSHDHGDGHHHHH
jgi:hypothetical protein